MAKLLVAPTKNAIQKTLAAQLLSTASTGDPITFDDVDGIPNLPGVLVINRVDSSGVATASNREYIEYSGTSGTTVLIKTRNVDGSNAALTHAVGSIVEFIPDVTWANRIYDTLGLVVDPSDISALKSGIELTSPVLNTGVSGTAVKDEDDMASNSATALATQQSIKAYVGTQTSTTSSATPTPTGDKKVNELYVTALAEAAEFAAPSGTPTNGNKLIIRVKDDGTARALTYNAIYRGIVATLPSTTVISKTLYMGFVYNSADSKWDLVATCNEA